MNLKWSIFFVALFFFATSSACDAEGPDCSPDLLVNASPSQTEVYKELELARNTSWFPESVEHYSIALKYCKSAKLQEEILRELALIHVFLGELQKAEECCLTEISELDKVSHANRKLDLASVRYLQGQKVQALELVEQAKPVLLNTKESQITLPFAEILWAKAEGQVNSGSRDNYTDYAFEAIRFQKSLLGFVHSSWLRRLAEHYSSDPGTKYLARNLLNEALDIDKSSKSSNSLDLVTIDRKLLYELELRKSIKPLEVSNDTGFACNPHQMKLINWPATEAK